MEPLPLAERKTLLELAHASLIMGIQQHSPLVPNPKKYPESLQKIRATFVTLHLHRELRGCIGVIEPLRPLVVDVAANAYAAGFEDPRFMPLQLCELQGLAISISVLSERENISFSSQEDLLKKIRSGIDGLILREGNRGGTFLPAVWETLTQPEDFLRELKRKSGLPENYWSQTLRVERFTAESF